MGDAYNTKPAMRGRPALWAMAMLLACGAQAQPAGDIDIQASTLAPRGSAAQTLQLHGTWPDSCTPRVDRAVLEGADLTVQLRTPSARCVAGDTAWQQFFRPEGTHGGILPRQVYRVSVHVDDSPEVTAFQLLDLSDGNNAITPENGFWWSVDDPDSGPALAGTGIGIEYQDGRVAASLLGFNERGEATWYFGSAELRDRSVQLELVALEGGDDGFSVPGSRPHTRPGPQLAIEFHGPAHASAWLMQASPAGLRLRDVQLSRASFHQGAPGAAWQGRWVLVATAADAAPDHAQRLDLQQASMLADDHFILHDMASTTALECRTTLPEGPPALCTLLRDQVAVADLDRIGLDRMSGYFSDGSAMMLLRIPD